MPRHFSLITFLSAGLTFAALCREPGSASDWRAHANADATRYTFSGPRNLETVWSLDPADTLLGRITASQGDKRLFQCNGLSIRKGSSPRESAVSPSRPLRLQRVRLSPSGSGSVSAIREGFHTPNREPVGEDKKTPHVRQTLGVDTSMTSGVPGVWTFVLSHFGFGKRHVDWTLDVPPGGTFQTIPGGFTYKLPNGNGSLKGLMLHPEEPNVEFTTNGQIRFKILESDEPGMTWEAAGPMDIAPLDDPLLQLEVNKNTKGDKKLSRQVGERILNVTTDTNMGSPTLKTRVRQHAVILLTWSPDGKHPAPKVHPDPDIWFTLGKQTVRYDEFLVDFENGMRDELSTLQWGGVQ